MNRRYSLRSPGAALLTGLGLCTILGLALSDPGYTDDRDLLRFASSKPYLFILLDTSSSMNLKIGAGDKPLPGGGDNPDSRLYAAKQALFNVFSTVDDVFFGFASFNQDDTYVKAKHYLYYNDGSVAPPAGWPIAWPAADPNGLTAYVDKLNLTGADVQPPLGTLDDLDGIPETVVSDIQGDAVSVGPIFDFSGNGNIEPAELNAGSCASPLPLGALGDVNRLKLDGFATLNTVADPKTAVLWISNGGQKYRVQVSHPASPNPDIGQDNMFVKYELANVTADCNAAVSFTYTPKMRLDSRLNQYLAVDGVPGAGDDAELVPNLWPGWSDAITSAACTNPHPHTGLGWEGNYDSGDPLPAGITMSPGPTNVDPHNGVEIKPITHTTYSTIGLPNPTIARSLDTGDVLPFDWNSSQRTEMLRRFAPNYGVDTPIDFGVASALQPSSVTGLYEPRLSGRSPLIGIGNSQLDKSILDFVCWYAGEQSPKCRGVVTANAGGWSQIACTLDPEYGCRRPYLIIISDGEDNCNGSAPTSEVASLNSKTGVKTWAINVGEPGNGPDPTKCAPNSALHSITQAGKGECVNVDSPEALLTTIQNILGRIREEARTFASAAVPSVQAIAKQSLYLTDFTPLNDHSRWPGHVNAFLKPLPTLNGKPDTTKVCSGTVTEGCFLWDAGKVVAAQTARRILYAQQSKKGLWAANWQDFQPTTDPGAAATDHLRYDLWRGFELIAPDTADNSLPAREPSFQTEINAVINETLSLQSRSPCDPTKELCQYKLGDIFHSDPLVFGGSFSADFLRTDSGSEFNDAGGTNCTATGEMSGANDNPDFNRGYRCFAERHGFRRQIVYIGSNDGMLHAFNAAQYRTATQRYDNGTGNELFAFMPRTVMPTVKTIAEGQEHHFTVDGPIHAADVFIDPIDDNDNAAFPRATERRWRTVLVAGLREGGRGYYALDVTQPDAVTGPVGGPFVPNYKGLANAAPTCLNDYNVNECGPVQYGAPLWEFTDNTDNQLFATPALQPTLPYKMDEDGNGVPDLAYSWSQADFARVQICEGTACTISPTPSERADVKAHFVVFFGGGFDPDHKDFDPRNATASDPDGPGPRPSVYDISGNWIYMVDVETGEVLYKRQLCSPYRTNAGNPGNPCVPAGSTPSAIAAVDTDLNGFVDRLYIGTTGGYMFRVDLQTITTSSGGTKKIEVPALQPVTVNALDLNSNPTAVTVKRIPATDSSGNPLWNPRVIFDANFTGTTPTTLPRPVFFAPSVIIYQDAGAYALAFGTGDRDNLWAANQQPGRFYVFMDDSDVTTAPAAAISCPTLAANAICPRTEADYASVPLDPSFVTRTDFLLSRSVGSRGWFLTLPNNERVITDTFSFSGLTFFSSYQPQIALTDDNGNPLSNVGTCGQHQYESNTTASCAKTGVSSLFLVSTVNGNGLLPGGLRTKQVSTFVTNPFTQLSTGNTGGGGGASPTPSSTPAPIPPAISDLFPKTCRFANARIDIATIAADTSLQELGSVPICMTQHSWKEF